MQILDELSSNSNTWYTAMELVKVIYAETPEHLWLAASRNVLQHLNKLQIESKVESKSLNTETGSHRIVWKYKQ